MQDFGMRKVFAGKSIQNSEDQSDATNFIKKSEERNQA